MDPNRPTKRAIGGDLSDPLGARDQRGGHVKMKADTYQTKAWAKGKKKADHPPKSRFQRALQPPSPPLHSRCLRSLTYTNFGARP